MAAKTKQQVVSEFRRGEIVRAARTVFARRGFVHAIVDEIAHEAHIAKGTVYLYFRSKAEIYRAVLDYDMKAVRQDTLEGLSAAPDLEGKLRAFATSRIENAEARKEFFRIMDSESGGLSFTRSQYRNWLREPMHRLAEAIERAAEQGVIRRVDAEKTAWLMADMTRGIIQRRLLAQTTAPPAADVEFLVEFICAALKPAAQGS